MLQRLAFLKPKTLHHPRHTVCRTEIAHQIVFKRHKKPRQPRIPLPRTTSAQLPINAPRLMTLSSNDIQPTDFPHTLAQFNVGTAPGHVCRNRHRPALSRLRDDLRLLLMVLRIQHRVRDFLALEHTGKHLALLHADGPHQHGLSLGVGVANLVDHGVELLTPSLVNHVVEIFTDARFVGGRDRHVQLVHIVELVCLCLGGSRHPREFAV